MWYDKLLVQTEASITHDITKKVNESSSAIAERPRCRVGQFWPKVEVHSADIIEHMWRNRKPIEFGEITENKSYYAVGSRSFKVTDVGTHRKHVCDFLLLLNTNWHLIWYGFEVLADYCSILDEIGVVTLCFWATVLNRQRKYTVHIIGLLESVLIELFRWRCYGLGATSEY